MYSTAKCKRCRQILFNERQTKSLFISAHSDVLNEQTDKENCTSIAELLCLSEDILPEWIIQVIEDSNWSKGKINCNNCRARIGSFDFISGTKCSCKSFILPPVHIVKSKRFRFCGDADCPDWVLAEINMLSKLSSVKLKLLAQVVTQGIITPPINIEKAEKIFADSKLDEAINLKACIACLAFIITSAIKYNCDHNALHSELQQLGLPREHSTSIKRVTGDNCADIAAKLKASSLKINPLQTFNLEVDKETNCVNLNMDINNKTTKVVMTPYTVDVLLENLKGVRETMKELVENPYNL